MKKIVTLVFFILPTVSLLAQNNNQTTAGANAASLNPSVRAGHFEMEQLNKDRGITEHVNVNYSLSPVPAGKMLSLELSTAAPTYFSVVVTDMKSREVAHWEPKQESYVYRAQIDVANIPAGKYNMVINWNNNSGHYSIPFEKTIQ